MNRLIPGFTHRPAAHCDTSVMRDLLEYHRFNFSEPVVFGLGGGLGFSYWHVKGHAFPLVSGCNEDLIADLCRNLGIAGKVNDSGSSHKAYEAVRNLVFQDEPVAVSVDVSYLKYYHHPSETHLSGHYVVVAGIDEDRGLAHLADSRFEGLQTVLLRDLESARSSRADIAPPRNRWYRFHFPEQLPALETVALKAMDQTVNDMLNPPARHLGVRGIRHLATQVLHWPEEFQPGVYARDYGNAYAMLQGLHTGGGAFRLLYARFLREISETLHDQQVLLLAGRLYTIGQEWGDAARRIKAIPESGAMGVGETARLLFQIADEEETVMRELGGIVRQKLAGLPKPDKTR